jgi:hypothetical protein
MRPLAAALAMLGALAVAPASRAQAAQEWDFIVRLDGKPVGTHRFTLARDGAASRTLTSAARFDVKLLGWTAYRYRHEARERWRGDCLAALDATTDDDGRVTQVRARRGEDGFAVEVSPPTNEAPAAAPPAGCVMSFAYWNTAFTSQHRLLDPGTGRLVPVQVQTLPPAQIETAHGPVAARGWRIAGLPHPIDVWYDGDEWAGLDTVVQGGRRLTYRLR